MSDQLRKRVLIALGDGGTTEMADRIVHWLREEYASGVRPEDLAGTSEVAAMLGVSKQTLCNWVARDTVDFPPAVAHLAATRVWNRIQVAAWQADHPDIKTGGLS